MMPGVTPEEFSKWEPYIKNNKLFSYALRDTWTKGKDFFFIDEGCVMQVRHIYNDHIFADVAYKGQIGLMKLADLKIILSNDDF
jgi:hypothetical protein